MTHDMLHVTEWHNGDKAFSPFSDAEMQRRHSALRDWMATQEIEATLFTSQHGVLYHSGWQYSACGRKYGLVLTPTNVTTIAAGIDGGAPWRRSHGASITYTDWRRDNFYRALRQLTVGVRRLAIEFDHVSLDFRRMIDAALPGVEMVDVSATSLWQRAVKSDEEIALLRKGAEIAALGARTATSLIRAGAPEYDIALATTDAMTRAIAAAFPFVELSECWTGLQSGPNTDGALNPVTNRLIRSGDILSLTCCPVLFGYRAALGRTLFCDKIDSASHAIWQTNLAVHRRAIGLIRPKARCNEIAAELNDLYREHGLLGRRTAGYGQSIGSDGAHHTRDSGVALREDVTTELHPGMVISLQPMVMLPPGMPGAGGYREQDMLVVTDTGAELLTDFPIGPDHNVLGSAQ